MAGFTINSPTFDKTLVSNGESLTITVQIKNTSGKDLKMYSVDGGLFVKGKYTDSVRIARVFENIGGTSVVWKNSATKTFTVTSTIDTTSLDMTRREAQIPVQGSLFTLIVYGNSSGAPTTREYESSKVISSFDDLGLVVIGERFNNHFAELSAERCDSTGKLDDEGENILVRAKVVSDHTLQDMITNGYPTTATVVISDDPNDFSGDGITTILSDMGTLLEGVEEYRVNESGIVVSLSAPDAIKDEIDKNKTWYIRILFDDKYDSVVGDTFSVARSFANVHFSGKSTGGVCFGGFSTSEENDPKFECYYPAYFKAGIVEGGISGVFDAGHVAALGNTAGGSVAAADVSFNKTFSSPPIVVAGFVTGSTAGSFGRCVVSVNNITETGFSLRFYNGDSSNRNPSFNWIAFGT